MNEQNPSPQDLPAASLKLARAQDAGERADPLLECLSFLTAHYGHARSAQALLAGLAYDERGMGPALFCEAAQNLGLKARIVSRGELEAIPRAVLPVVLILKGNQACVLLELAGGNARIYIPESKGEQSVPTDTLGADYTGYAIYVHTQPHFERPEIIDEQDERLHWFWSVVRENRETYGMVLLGGVLINIFGLASPLFIMNVYDRVIPNSAIETGWVLGIGALVVFAFDLLMRSLRGYLIDVGGRRIDIIAAKRIYDHLLNMKLAFRPKSSGSFANMLREFDSVREFFTSATVTALVDLPFTILFLGVVFYFGGVLGAILVFLIVSIIAVGFMIQAQLKSSVRRALKTAETKHGLLVETIYGLETLKAARADGRLRARYLDYVADNAVHAQDSRFWSSLGVNLSTFIQQIAAVLLILAGMYMVKDGTLSMGALIACVMVGGRAMAPIGQIASLMTRYHQAGSALKTLNKIMSQPTERPAGKQFLHRPDLSGAISFENVCFSYPGVDRRVLDRVSFSIRPGERVGIIGRIGSGKSTIARLMMGLYEPEEGAILMDSTDCRQIDPADIRRNIAYIAQDVVLLSGTVRENIAASVPGASEESILAAARMAGVHDFIARHPMGYDAPVGERGEGLSGGQRQAIALARAMLLRPRVLLCDEPTNAMDSQAEESFMRCVAGQMEGRTLVLITHKQPMLSLVQRLILMDLGRVVMDGPRDEVLQALQAGKVQVKAS